MTTMKICTKCGRRRQRASFYKRSSSKDGLQPLCKRCQEKKSQAYDRSHGAAAKKRRHLADPRRHMLLSAKRRARLRGLSFTLRLDDIEIPEFCPVLGHPLQVGTRASHEWAPSVDRIAPVLGYVPQNVRVISYRANRLKSDASVEELEAVLRYMRGQA